MRKILFGFILLIVFPPFAIWLSTFYVNNIRKNYVPIVKETQISGYTERIHYERGTTTIKMVSGKKFRTHAVYREINTKSEFGDKLKLYDSIYKAANSDTIYVLRGNEKFVFVFNEILR